MATHVYACLCGEWVNLSSDPNCKMGENMTSPTVWWEEDAKIWSPKNKNIRCINRIMFISITKMLIIVFTQCSFRSSIPKFTF